MLFLGNELLAGVTTPFSVDADALKAHTCVTGRSGCGKSTLVARLCEEIVLRNAGNIVFFDFNYEFSQFFKPDPSAFGADCVVVSGCAEDNAPTFDAEWKKVANEIKAVPAPEMRVPFAALDAERLAYLLGLRRYEDAGAYWMIQMLLEDRSLSADLNSWKDLRKRFRMFARWAEGRRKASDPGSAEVAYQFQSMAKAIEHARLRNALDARGAGTYVWFGPKDPGPKGEVLDDDMFEKMLAGRRFTGLDLLNFTFGERQSRAFIMLHVLRSLWDRAKERFRAAKAKGAKAEPPVFIVIDEAHNLVGEDGGTSPIRDIVETIAAEGRKFNLFLVLLTQRPDKIARRVFSECENFVLMRSTPQVVDHFRQSLGIGAALIPDDTVRKLPWGQAIFYGKFTDEKAKHVAVGVKRTTT